MFGVVALAAAAAGTFVVMKGHEAKQAAATAMNEAPKAPVAAAPPAPPTPHVEDTHGLEGDGLARARRIQANLRRMADAVPAVLAFQEAAAALGADGAKMDLGALLGFPR